MPEARYAYYRRCQVFRRGGEQCKAPAEKGSHICHAHAGQLALALRRERERQAVLAEAVAEMRRRGCKEFEAKDLLMDFKGIQMTAAVMARALIDGRVNSKTAGRLVVQLQTMSKLLWMYHKKTKTLPLINTDNTDLQKSAEGPSLTAEAQRRSPHQARTGLVGDPGGEEPKLPQICADERRWRQAGASTTKDTKEREEAPGARTEKNLAANEHEETRIALVTVIRPVAEKFGRAHGPPERLRAA